MVRFAAAPKGICWRPPCCRGLGAQSVTQSADYLPLDEGNSNRLDGKAFRMHENEGLGSFDADYRRLLARS